MLLPSDVYTTKLLLKTAVRVISGNGWSFGAGLDEDVGDGTDEAKGCAELKEGALPGSLVDVRTPHAEDILALVHHFTKVLALLDIPPAERVSVLQRLVGELRVAVQLRVDLLSGGQGEVFVCDGELCGGGGEAGSNGGDATCCWACCAEEGWGKHGGRMRVSVSVCIL